MEQPKVRFSQASDSFAVHAGDEDAVLHKSKGKVKIKSIVPTTYPVKVLKNGQRVLLKEKRSNVEINKEWGTSSNASGYSKLRTSTSSVPSIYVTEEHDSSGKDEYRNVNNSNAASDNQSIKNKDDLEDCIDKLQRLSFECSTGNTLNCAQQTNTIREKDESLQSSKNDSFKSCLDNDEDSDIEVIQVIEKPISIKPTKNNKTCKDNRKKNFKKENKENKSIKGLSNNQQNNNKTKVLKDATNPSSDKNKNLPSKKFTKSQNKIQLMPCAKFREAALSKNKSAGKVRKEEAKKSIFHHVVSSRSNVPVEPEPCHKKVSHHAGELKKEEVRKSMVYHVASSRSNVSVEPGTFHKKCKHPAYNDIEESNEKTHIESEDLLSRPEYNSTVCVMKNLKKLENEKLITDLQHLPQEYKNLIYGKVSAGLDIGPYECIYKDLINISVDDNKFPARLMRSKDPEPRDKDIVPKISDFYQPKFAEQYFIVANPVVPQPINLNTLSAFTISNKICTWKNARDNF